MSSPVTKPLSSRRSRRATVLATYTGFAALTAFSVTSEAAGLAPAVGEILFYAVILGAMGAFVILKRNVRELADLPDAKLDERQLADRNRTYRVAYKALGALVFVAGAYIYVHIAASGRLDLPVPGTTAQANAILWWIWLLTVTLPSLIMAWKEPDPLEDSDGR